MSCSTHPSIYEFNGRLEHEHRAKLRWMWGSDSPDRVLEACLLVEGFLSAGAGSIAEMTLPSFITLPPPLWLEHFLMLFPFSLWLFTFSFTFPQLHPGGIRGDCLRLRPEGREEKRGL